LSWRRKLEERIEKLINDCHPWRSSFTNVTCEHHRSLRAVVSDWHHSLIFLHVAMPLRRILGFSVVLHADGDPSGIVPSVVDDSHV
jgi:hypothetical protein